MDHRFLEDIIAHKPQLFRAILNFNRNVSDVPKELSSLGSSFTVLWHDPYFRRAWPSALSDHTGYWNFSEESQRLALLDSPTLERLGLFFSAAVHAEELSRIIAQKQVLELRQQFGQDILSYALKRGRYQIGGIREVLQVPVSFGPLVQRIRILAAEAPAMIGTGWPEELKVLALPRFPHMDGAPHEEKRWFPHLRREQRRALWFTMKKLLLREVAPQWAPCFD